MCNEMQVLLYWKMTWFLLGGGVALKVHLKQHQLWDGAILLAPMCKIADDVIPPWPMVHLLIDLSKVLPKEKLVPQKDLAEMAFKELKKREQTSYNVIGYRGKPRLRIVVEMLQTTQEIDRRLEEAALLSQMVAALKGIILTSPALRVKPAHALVGDLEKGELQVAGKERESQLSSQFRDIATIVMEKTKSRNSTSLHYQHD